jgi:hypothetical protein
LETKWEDQEVEAVVNAVSMIAEMTEEVIKVDHEEEEEEVVVAVVVLAEVNHVKEIGSVLNVRIKTLHGVMSVIVVKHPKEIPEVEAVVAAAVASWEDLVEVDLDLIIKEAVVVVAQAASEETETVVVEDLEAVVRCEAMIVA